VDKRWQLSLNVKLALAFAAIATFFFDFLFLFDLKMWAEDHCPNMPRSISCRLAGQLASWWPLADLLLFAGAAVAMWALLTFIRRYGDRTRMSGPEA